MHVTLGAPGRIMPPAAKAIEFAQRAEQDGFDAIWWPCHLMGWVPDSVWTEDMTELARYQPNPHEYFEPLAMMGAAGAATQSIKVGVCVTDTIRRHPAMLAQATLTADHLSSGRAILGLGSGERMNVQPYGMEWHKPVSRLEEAIRVMRLLWSTDKPVDFDGEFFTLRDAVLGLAPYEGRPPQVWLAAHGPRMLRITGRLADGWLPTNIRPDAYAEKLAVIRESADEAGRDPDAIVPSMLAYVLVRARRGDARADVRLADGARAVRRRRPPGRDLRAPRLDVPVRGRHGLSLVHPDAHQRAEVERIVSHIPGGIVREHTLAGTPEMLAEQIRTYAEAGLRDVVLWNITPFADPTQSVYSFRALRELRKLLAPVAAS